MRKNKVFGKLRKNPTEHDLRNLFAEARGVNSELRRNTRDFSILPKNDRALGAFLLEHGLWGVLEKLLPLAGQFYRTAGGELLFFRKEDHRLYDVEGKAFEQYLVWMTESPEGVRRHWLPTLRARVRFEAPEVTPHFLAYNDSPDLNVIAINTFDGYMMRRKRGGTWRWVSNGTDGVLFRTPPDFLTPWQPDFEHGGTGKDLEWLCSLGHFSDDGPLSVDDQRSLLHAWILHLFVPALNPVHPIPLQEGVTGSGKTVSGECIGRWLTGPEFEVVGLPSGNTAKAEETLTLAIYKRPLVVIDNVDSPTPWLEDFLCRAATGVRMSRRRLYTNSEEVHFTPRAGVIITSRDPHFRREDVARRILPIRFKEIPEEMRRTETEIRAEVEARRGSIWADVLAALARIQDSWPTLKGTLRSTHSLADFAVFGALLAAAHSEDNNPDEWDALMGRLDQAQHRFTGEGDPLAELLDAALEESKGTLHQQPVSDLFRDLRDLAQISGWPWPYKDTRTLTRELKGKKQTLEHALDVRIVLSNNHRGGVYHVSITKSPDGPYGPNRG
ncbi:MAG: hypothetical protein V3W22_04880 [Thermoplasmata archaeon]